MKDYYCEIDARSTGEARLPAACSPTSSASRATPTAPATRSTSRSARATRSSRRCSWPARTPRCPTAARSTSRASARRSSAPDGTVLKRIQPKVQGHVPCRSSALRVRRQRPAGRRRRSAPWPGRSSTSRSTRCTSAAKTGSAEVYGKQSTSWVASYDENYVVVMMGQPGRHRLGHLRARPCARSGSRCTASTADRRRRSGPRSRASRRPPGCRRSCRRRLDPAARSGR